VSRGTVSRALNGGHHVSPAAREAVARAVRKTGYTANRNARGLVTQRSGSVAFILSENHDKLFDDPVFNTLLRHCTRALARVDVSLVLMIAGSADERKRAWRLLDSGHADGAMLISPHRGDPIMDGFVRRGLPAVACGKPLGHESDLSYAAVDERSGARQMTEHLIERGRRRIATITGPQDTPGGVERLIAYREVMAEHGLEPIVEEGDYTDAGGGRATLRLLERHPDIDAIFVASDLMALGALWELPRAGRRVPDDVAVGGFDDSRVAASATPPLTTIRQPFSRIADEMVRLLFAAMGGGEPAAAVLPVQLIVRDST